MRDWVHLLLHTIAPHIRALDNGARTVNMCLDEDLVQELTWCECLHDHHDTACHEAGASMRLWLRACRSTRLTRALLGYMV
jgi:hypothetical protein